MKSAFPPLADALAAALRRDRERFLQAIHAVDAQAMFAQAARHKCVPVLLSAFSQLRIADPATRPLRSLLQQYAAKALTASAGVEAQMQSIARALDEAAIPFCFLKTGARLRRGDAQARWMHMGDIDVLVPPECADAAVAALERHGYRTEGDHATIAWWRERHHHRAPLVGDAGEKPVEVHCALERTWLFDTPTDWHALRAHLQPVAGERYEHALDAYGRALHALLHSVGMRRLLDAALIAHELETDPPLLSQLERAARSDRRQCIPMLASLYVAARFAGASLDVEDDVRRYADWCFWRETLPPAYGLRLHMLDAWFASGGSFGGAPMQLALSDRIRLRSFVGRVLVALTGAVHYNVLRYASRR